jgi:hypothetical protein
MGDSSVYRDFGAYGHRKLYELPEFGNSVPEEKVPSASVEVPDPDLLTMISSSVIGRDLTFVTPFGKRQVFYCDYTASGRSLSFIEDYIRDVVLVSSDENPKSTAVAARLVNGLSTR